MESSTAVETRLFCAIIILKITLAGYVMMEILLRTALKSITNSSYSSRLNVTVTPEMHNGTVECIQDDFNETFIGTCTLTLTTGKI